MLMRSMTRRALVLTSESAGHWLRRSLPPHVFTEPLVDVPDEDVAAARRWRLSGGDWQRFLATYCAGFVAVSLFIA